MNLQAWWWVAVGLLGVAEIFTGSFYLLVFALGALAAALLAMMGIAWPWQLLAAAAVSAAGWLWVHKRRLAKPLNDAQSLDLGETVQVTQWQGQLGLCQYRGAQWQVEWQGVGDAQINSETLQPGVFKIRAIRGNRLVVSA
jgi:membrane protein implicated in regulation of membrane protease activity